MEVMQLISSIDWERESYPVYKDLLALPIFAIFFPTVRFLLDRYVFENVARRLILGKGYQKLNMDANDRKKITKFKESAWKCIYYLSSEILTLSVTYSEPWFRSTKYYWAGPGDQVWPDQKIKYKLKAVYMYAAGFYTYSIFALMFWETRRSDIWVLMAHHVISTFLIVFSYIYRFSRAGSIVLAIHDASDVFLEMGKMSKYSGFEAIASVSFLLFVISWVLLRLIFYPFWILRSTSCELMPFLDKQHEFDGPIYYYVLNTPLFFLLVLHIYWWVLIFRMLVKQFKSQGQVSDDIRSDSEDEDSHED